MDRYDRVPYTSRAIPLADPDRIAAVARVLGLNPPEVNGARVLEVGCASGGHLRPLAAHRSQAHFVGIDRSGRQIRDGLRARDELGLRNLDLLHLDLVEADGLGTFDYVVAHGLFSWVPREVQERLLARIAEWLSPDGVAYVSFNCRPGCHARAEMRHMLRHQLAHVDDPLEQVRRARATLSWLARHAADSPWGRALRLEIELLEGADDAYLFHDLLAPINEPLSLPELLERVQPHGLAYLGDADFGSMVPERLPAQVQQALAQLAPHPVLGVEPTIDLLTSRSFRQALLVRQDRRPDRVVGWERLRALVPWAVLTRTDEGWRARGGQELTPRRPLMAAVLQILAARGTAGIPFDALVTEAAQRAGAPPDPERVGAELLSAWVHKAIQLSTCALPPPSLDPPWAPPVVRWEARHASAVANVRHEIYELSGPDREALQACDGTQPLEQIRARAPSDAVRIEALARHGFLSRPPSSG